MTDPVKEAQLRAVRLVTLAMDDDPAEGGRGIGRECGDLTRDELVATTAQLALLAAVITANMCEALGYERHAGWQLVLSTVAGAEWAP